MRMTADGAKADSQGTSAPARVIAAAGFVHLHVHSSYSLREGAIPIGKLAKLAAGARDYRFEQPFWRLGVLGKARQGGRAADRGPAAHGRFPRDHVRAAQ